MAELKISQIETEATANALTDLFEIEQGGVSKKTTLQKIVNAIMPKEYIALISQSSTSVPTLTIIKNDFTGTITATRNGAGDYTLTNSVSEFTANKTVVNIDNSTNYAVKFTGATRTGGTTISLATFNLSDFAADTLLLNDVLKIQVYP